MPKPKWMLTARTRDGSPLDSLGNSSTTIFVYDGADLARRLRGAGDRPDLKLTVAPVRQTGPRRSH